MQYVGATISMVAANICRKTHFFECIIRVSAHTTKTEELVKLSNVYKTFNKTFTFVMEQEKIRFKGLVKS